jgi:hypothetical protein
MTHPLEGGAAHPDGAGHRSQPLNEIALLADNAYAIDWKNLENLS